MSRDLSALFQLTNQTALEQDAALPSVSQTLSYTGLSQFSSDRDRIERKLETLLETAPKPDFSDFANHVYFDSAMSKFDIAKSKILDTYPYNGNAEDIDLFMISGSYYENYVTNQWPRSVGYAFFSGGNYLSASDSQGALYLPLSSSLYITARVAPALAGVTNNILSVLSGNAVGHQFGYTLTTTDTIATFTIVSGAFQYTHQAYFTTSSITNRFATLGVIYDWGQQNISMWLDASKKSTTTFNAITRIPTFGPANVVIGKNYTGSIGEIRIMLTASEAYHTQNYNQPITSEDFVKLNYRFNEGTNGLPALDARVVDYSKSNLNALFSNYTPTTRRSGATATNDPGDLILYASNPAVIAFTSSQETAAEIYDATNRNYIIRLLPDDLIIDDQSEQGILTTFALAMARYFDDLKMYVDQFDNLRITSYDDVNETPDLMLPLMTKYFGWKVTDHFSDSEPLQFLFGQNVLPTGSLDVPLLEIKNQFWRRILNNLPYLYKTKGKRNNIDSFFNVLGINPNLVNLKEYGSVYASTIDDDWLLKQKDATVLSLTGSGLYQTPTIYNKSDEFTIEILHCPSSLANQISDVFYPISADYDVNGFGGQVQYYPPLTGAHGAVLFTGPDGQQWKVDNAPIFNGEHAHFSFVSRSGSVTFGLRQYANGAYYSTSSQFATSNYYSGSVGAQIAIGAYYYSYGTFLEGRAWGRALSSTDLDAHAYNFENVAEHTVLLGSGSSLLGRWSFNSSTLDSVGQYNLNLETDPGTSNPYEVIQVPYGYLSPTFDLKWTQNKVRIRNASTIDTSNLGNDNSEIALEFNLVDALNEDIAKIFSSFDDMNNIIGAPVNKYRDEYHDLEVYRSIYFQRLTDSLNFTRFFKLFRWFDKKLATSIKQLLPARSNFIGGEFVVESHMLERNKYQYQYPVFHTPKDINEASMSLGTTAGAGQSQYAPTLPMRGTTVRSRDEAEKSRYGKKISREESVLVEGNLMPRFQNVSQPDFCNSADNAYRRLPGYSVAGVSKADTALPSDAVNFRQSYQRKIYDRHLQNDLGAVVNPSISDGLWQANGFVFSDIDADDSEVHYSGIGKNIGLRIVGTAGASNNTKIAYTASNGPPVTFYPGTQLWDQNNVKVLAVNSGAFLDYNQPAEKISAVLSYCFSASANPTKSGALLSDFLVQWGDGNSSAWPSLSGLLTSNLTAPYGNVVPMAGQPGWYQLTMYMNQALATKVKLADMVTNATGTGWAVTLNTASIYVFKDMRVDFPQPLSNAGVRLYDKLDNTNNDGIMTYRNPSVLKPAGEIIGTSNFYQWNNNPLRAVVGQPNIYTSLAAGQSLPTDAQGNVYFIGDYLPPAGTSASTGSFRLFVSPDNGKTFTSKQIQIAGAWAHLYSSQYVLNAPFCVDPQNSNYVYACYQDPNQGYLYIIYSTDGGTTWNAGASYTDTPRYPTTIYASGSNVFVGFNSGLIRSTNRGISGSYSILSSPSVAGTNIVNIQMDASSRIVVLMDDYAVRRSPDGSTWTTVYSGSGQSNPGYQAMVCSSTGYYYLACVQTGSLVTVVSSSTGNYGGWSAQTNFQPSGAYAGFPRMVCDQNGQPFFSLTLNTSQYNNASAYSYYTNLFTSYNNGTTWNQIDSMTSGSVSIAGVSKNQTALSIGNLAGNAGFTFTFRYATPHKNVEYYGPRSLAVSTPYLSMSAGVAVQKYALGNINEYPHFGGLFQMPNIVLGTTVAGTIGTSDDSLVQVQHIGSVVNVMWPDQSTLSAPVPGFGELSVGQSPGNLSTGFTFGTSYDVTDYDHMSLYCYALKQVSGTMDDILVQIQRRPLLSVGFATDQSVEYSSSGSFTEARYRDINHTKAINYGDLTNTQISYVIDVPLVNVREVRIGACQKNGQADQTNQNFLVWGRFIDSTKET